MKTKLMTKCAMVAVLAFGSAASADWIETNNDGGPGGLDYSAYWVAAWNGSDPAPATTWYTAAALAGTFGTDAGWTGNVVNITDADAFAYAAANKVESFTDVKATVAVSTSDIDEEFGVLVRASNFSHGGSITTVDGYGATFSVDGATEVGQPMKFSLYKIVDGVVVAQDIEAPLVPASLDDFIVFIELTAEGGEIDARLFSDTGDSVALATAHLTDASPLPGGYTGVINLDAQADGISAYYDTLSSQAIPEPTTLTLAALGLLSFVFYTRRRRR